ncbi:ion transporter [Geopsychrobacter electrodiphilus]|uniref:ion transporter n=1 Tax=Geopsychrobacter electrodiphilus TaxID=225196 RepID=UPI000379BC47
MTSHLKNPLRSRLHEIIFEADTPAGKMFDLLLQFSILASVLIVMLDSVASIRAQYGNIFYIAEWFFTLLFTLEYVLRLYCIGHPLKYARSFFGIVDLLSVLPTYLALLLPGGQVLLSIRILRLLRIFRILKMVKFVGEAEVLLRSLRSSGRKIIVFLLAIVTLVVIFGAVMYLVEGEKNGFTSIPRSIYWAIVTMTTVGYGDISPRTDLGQAIAAFIMVLGYGIIAIPTGIVTAELALKKQITTQSCPECSAFGHDPDAEFCKYCGEKLNL